MNRLGPIATGMVMAGVIALGREVALFDPLQGGESDRFAAEATDQALPGSQRDRALSSLSSVDFDRAIQVAPALLSEKEESLRFRAAWILADGNKPLGFETLRALASDEGFELRTLAAKALGRLRDPESRVLLRDLLKTELSRSDWSKARPNVGALTGALSEYADPRDSELLALAVRRHLEHGGTLVDAEELGRTAGPEAIPVLEEVFTKRGRGWAVMGAGLGLARCGSEKGRVYVAERLDDSDGCRYPNGKLQDGVKDDPFGPRATEYILTHLGVPADEVFIPALLNLVSDSRFVELAKTHAWSAMARINPAKYRQQVLDLAWRNTGYDGAARLIVLNDKSRARAELSRSLKAGDGSSRGRLSNALTSALNAGPRERRRWRETRGYAF